MSLQVWILLLLAVVFEITGTTFLKLSEGFTRLYPSVAVLIFYSFAFYFLSLTLKNSSAGLVYAIWCGLGIVFISIVGYFIFGQSLDLWAILGLIMIISGIAIISILSKSLS